MKIQNLKIHHLRYIIHFINLRKFTKPSALCISALFIISMLSVFSSAAVQAEPNIFGNTAIGATKEYCISDYRELYRYQASTTGNITQLSVYTCALSGSPVFKMLIYSESSGTPTTLLATSSQIQPSTSWAWYSVSVIVPVTSGNYYWLGFIVGSKVGDSIGETYDSGGQGNWYSNSYGSGPSSPSGTLGGACGHGLSIYANVTYSSSLPELTSMPAPTPTPMPTGELPLSILGDDYMCFQTNWDSNGVTVPYVSAPYASNVWTSSKLAVFTQYHCTAARLGMAFSDMRYTSSTQYDHTQMSQVLDRLNSVGVKGILDLQNNGERAFNGYFGSTAMVNNWVQVAKDFKGDSRVLAFNIFNEPNPSTWCASGYVPSVGAITSIAKVHQFMAYLIDQIRAVDPTRTIIYPVFWGMSMPSGYEWRSGKPSMDWQGFYNDLNTAGILSKGNIVYDIVHPYFYETSGLDHASNPVSAAEWFGTNVIAPAVTMFGASHVWIGETFPWSSSEINPNGFHFTEASQKAFSIALINNCVSKGVGLQEWGYFSRQHYYTSNWYDYVIQNS